MMLLLACAPLLTAILILGFTRLPGWIAAGAALFAALPALLSSIPDSAEPFAHVLSETLRGSWLAWHAISVMVAGLYFHTAIRSTQHSDNSAVAPVTESQLFTLVIFIGPFVESAVGFGVGIVVIVGYLLQRGVPPMCAALLSLLSQTMVPWGAFAVGTLIGAQIAQISLVKLAVGSALISLPLMLAWLPFYWRLAGQAAAPSQSRLKDSAWVVFAMLLLVLANATLDPQIALITAFGVVIVLRQLFATSFSGSGLLRQLVIVWPYLALCTVLLMTRIIEPLGRWLQSLSHYQPLEGELAFAPFYHPGFWLLIVGSASLLANRLSLISVVAQTLASAWRPVLVTLLFVVMARWMISAGSARTMAEAIAEVMGNQAIVMSPLLAGVAGFLTGSNTASNAMMMSVQSALAAKSNVSMVFLSSVQNVSGSAMTALSPARIVFASTLAGGIGERALYRSAAQFAAPPLVILVLMCTVAVAL